MITYESQKQLTLEGFETPFEVKLDSDNRWMKLSQCIPWDELASGSSESIITAWPACKRRTLGNWRGYHQT